MTSKSLLSGIADRTFQTKPEGGGAEADRDSKVCCYDKYNPQYWEDLIGELVDSGDPEIARPFEYCERDLFDDDEPVDEEGGESDEEAWNEEVAEYDFHDSDQDTEVGRFYRHSSLRGGALMEDGSVLSMDLDQYWKRSQIAANLVRCGVRERRALSVAGIDPDWLGLLQDPDYVATGNEPDNEAYDDDTPF